MTKPGATKDNLRWAGLDAWKKLLKQDKLPIYW